jgi:hypothetical protein
MHVYIYIYIHIYMHTHIRVCGVDQPSADAFFKRLEAEAFRNAEELLGKVPAAAQRLWTSALMMECVHMHACVNVWMCVCIYVCMQQRRGCGPRP